MCVGLYPVTSSCCDTLANEPNCITPGGCWRAEDDGDGPLFNQSDSRVQGIPHLPASSAHPSPQSAGMPTSFALQTARLSGQRTMLLETTGTTIAGHPYPSHPNNVMKAARNLAECIAHDARADASGAHPIRIYTLGLGQLLEASTGVQPAETGSSVLRRSANDPASESFDATQPEGKYYFAADVTQLGAAFDALHEEIVGLSQ